MGRILKKGDKVVHVAGVKGTIIKITMVPIYTVRWDQGGYESDCKGHDLRRVQNGRS